MEGRPIGVVVGRFSLTSPLPPLARASRNRSLTVLLGCWSYRHPAKLLILAVLAMMLSIVLAACRMTLETDWLVLFAPERPEIQRLQYWQNNLPVVKDMAIIVSGGDSSDRQRAVDELGQAMDEQSELLESPLYSLDAGIFLRSGLYYLPKEQLIRIDSDVRALLSGMGSAARSSSLEVEELTNSLISGDAGARLIMRYMEALEALTRPNLGAIESSLYWPPIVAESAKIREIMDVVGRHPVERIYLSLDRGLTLLVLVSPKIEGQNLDTAGPSVQAVRSILQDLRGRFPQLTFSLTGEPVLAVDERQTISADSFRSTLCSVVLVLLLFCFGYKEITRPLLALASLVVGLTWTLGCAALAVGHLNFISVTYIPILVGIGIDFGIHVSFRYFEFRAEHQGFEAIEQTMRTAGKYTIVAAMANSIPFAMLVWIGFRGVAELGLVAIFGIVLCQLAACSVLPALLALLERREFQLPLRGRRELASWFERLHPWNGVALALTGVITVICSLGVHRAEFDIHLLKIQNPKLESVQTELMLIAASKSSVLTALVPARSLGQARVYEDRLRALPSVAEVISLSTFLPRVEPGETALVKSILEFRPQLLVFLRGLSTAPPLEARQALRIFSSLGQVPREQRWGADLRGMASKLQKRLRKRGPGPLLDGANKLLKDVEIKAAEVTPLLEIQEKEPLHLDELPHELIDRLRGRDGTYVLRIFPRHDIWRPENLDRFLTDVRGVSDQVSGEPVLIELFEKLVLETHHRGILYSLVALSLLNLLVLRSFRLAVLAALPTALSLIQVLGLMGFLSWTFNPANFVAVPMLLGVGSVFGLQSVLRMRELGNSRLLCSSTGLAIGLSAATTVAGFASLGLADHRGIASLGVLVTVGLLLNAILSLCVLPCLVARYPSLLGETSEEAKRLPHPEEPAL